MIINAEEDPIQYERKINAYLTSFKLEDKSHQKFSKTDSDEYPEKDICEIIDEFKTYNPFEYE